MTEARILVVEDEAIVARDLCNRLARMGYTVVENTASGEAAIALAGQHLPDLVLMDIRLRGDLDGIAVAEQIRANYQLPVVYLTAHADDATVDRARVTEPFGYILKPFDERELRTVIEMALYKHQAERKLKASERRFATTLASIGDAVIATDQNAKVTFLNPVAEHLTGWKLDQAAGKALHEIFRIFSEETRATVENPVDRVLREGVVVGLANHWMLISRDGREFPIDDCAAPIFDDRGMPTGAVLVFRDCTESRLREEKDRHSQKMEAIGLLAGGIAHDFNNMLTVILGYSDVLLNAMGAEHPWFGILTEIQRASHRSAELTKQLLAFSRKQMSQPTVINLNQVVTGIDQMLRRVIGENFELQCHLDESVGAILADPGQVEQLLVNLVVNARDATPSGGKIMVETQCVSIDQNMSSAPLAEPGKYQVLRVIDNGVGMDAVTKSRIFEPFFTTKDVGKGTGLGLASVYGIAQMCNAHIDVKSAVGMGTTIGVYFPSVSESVNQKPAQNDSKIQPGNGTILLIEDESAVRDFIKHVLLSCGYTVLDAENGVKGIEVSESYSARIDLVITDLVMPEMGGLAFIEALEKTRPGIKAICISGYANTKLGSENNRRHQLTVLQKPFTQEALTTAVQELLQQKIR